MAEGTIVSKQIKEICYTKDGNKKSLLSLSERITTPSIKIVGTGMVEMMTWEMHDLGGGHVEYVPRFESKPMELTWFVPLFVGNKGSTVDYNRYRYTLSGFKVGNYHAAESRAWINRAPVIRLLNYPAKKANGTGITFTIEYSDEDNDNCTIEYGCQRPYYGNVDNVKRGSVDVSASSNAQSVNVSVDSSWTFDNGSYYSVYAKITDPSGESAIATAKILKGNLPYVTEYYYAYNLRWIAPGITFFLGIGATDPDGGQLTWNWTSSDDRPASSYHHAWELEYSVYNAPYVIEVKGNKNIGDVTFYANISNGYESINSSISVNITSSCYLNMIDHLTRYTGSIAGYSTGAYTSEYWNRITGFEDHDGTPYLQFIGFPDDYAGQQVGFVFVKDHVHNHITEKFPDLHPDNEWNGGATITLDIWNDTRNVLLNGSRNDIPDGRHGAIRVGTGYLPYGKYTFCAFLESKTDPGKYYVYCCHIDNELTGHGSVD